MCTHYCELCHWFSVTVVNKLLHPFNGLFSMKTWESDCEVTTLRQYTTHTHTFNGPLSGTTWVSRYQKGKTSLDFTEASDSGISWAICKSTMPAPTAQILQAGCPSCRPTNSIKALKAILRRYTNMFITTNWPEKARLIAGGAAKLQFEIVAGWVAENRWKARMIKIISIQRVYNEILLTAQARQICRQSRQLSAVDNWPARLYHAVDRAWRSMR